MSAFTASLCVAQRLERRQARASRCGAHAGARCAAAGDVSRTCTRDAAGDAPPACARDAASAQPLFLGSRRTALAAAGLLASAALLRAAADAEEADAPETWTRYTRAFRERFETSISSATRAYTFEHPASWTPDIVSLNDGKLYGVDLRLRSKTQGQLAVSLLPYVGRDTLADAGPPEAALDTFVELIGAFWDSNGFGKSGGLAGSVLTAKAETKGGQLYYVYETASHNLIKANVTDGQLYLLTVNANERQWRSSEATLRRIAASFAVPA